MGGEIHSDVWGPASTETLGHRRYNSLFIDDHSRYTLSHLQRTKDETFDSYKKVKAFYCTQKGVQIKCLHTDHGGEYMSEEFSNYLATQGTTRKLTAHDTPEYNGVSERANRTIFEKVHAMLRDSRLPNALWGEAANYAVYVKNCTLTRALNGRTPYKVFWGRKPSATTLHPWGCEVRVHSPGGSKLADRARIGRWVGWDEQSDAHRIYWPDRRSVTVKRSVRFNAAEADVKVPLEGEDGGQGDKTKDNGNKESVSTHRERAPTSSEPDPTADPDAPVEATVPPNPRSSSLRPALPSNPAPPAVESRPEARDVLGERFETATERPKHVRQESDYVRRLRSGEGSAGGRAGGRVLPRGMQEATSKVVEEAEDEGGYTTIEQEEREEWETVELAMVAASGNAEGIEPTYAEAKKHPDWPKWKAAVQAELDSLTSNGTWHLVERPTSGNVVDSKWVLRIKKNSAGEVDKYKARLVARGFTQIYGVDYYKMFAPVAKLSSFRLILAIAARNGWPADSFDFNSAYLNSKLDEDVYLEQPPDHAIADRRKYVLKLDKALYGLKQGGRKWYETLCVALADLGFKRAEADYGVFFKHEGPHLIILAIHVDDCLITGDSRLLLDTYKHCIGQKYRLTDLGPVSWLLGIKVSRDLEARTLALSQHSYINAIITRFNFDDLKPISTPMDPHLQLSKSQCPESASDVARMKRIPYREAIGALMYAAMGT